MTMKRREFLKTSALAAAGASLAGAGGLWPRPSLAARRLTGVTYLPQSYVALSYGSNGFVEYLKENHADLFNVDFYDSGQLLKADEQLPALRARSIDFMFHTSSYITRSTPILGITGLPGVVDELYRNPERLAMGSPLFQLINDELAKENLYMLSAGGGILEPEYIWSTEAQPVHSLAELRGKKVRVVSFEATNALASYNISAVRIPSSETYMALQRGTIDAAVMNISTVVGRSLQEQLSVCYRLPMTAYTVAPFMLRDTWDRLPDAERSALQAAAEWYDANFATYCNNVIYGEQFWPKMRDAGIDIVEPSDEDAAAYAKAGEGVREEWTKEVGADVGHRAIALATGQA